MVFVHEVGGHAWAKDHIEVDGVVYYMLRSSPPIPLWDPGGENWFCITEK